MANRLFNLTLFVNDEQIAYKDGTLTATDGFGTDTVENAVLGGEQTEMINDQDIQTKKGTISFSMHTTAENEALKRKWKLSRGANVIQLVGPAGSGFTKVFTQCTCVNDPPAQYYMGGVIEVEFEGKPAT